MPTQVHRCPKCRHWIATKGCILCDGYVPTIEEARSTLKHTRIKDNYRDTPGIRVISTRDLVGK